MKEDRREQSEQSFGQVKFCKYDYWVLILILFFLQENKSYYVKNHLLILCLRAAKHHIANSTHGKDNEGIC